MKKQRNQQDTQIDVYTPHLSVAGYSETGRLLAWNEDAFALYDKLNSQWVKQFGRLYLLADGVGGSPENQTASRIAIETIPAVYYAQQEYDSPLVRLQQAFLTAHTRIREYADEEGYAKLETTCTAVVVKETQFWIAHVGDSRAYLVQPSSASIPPITRLTMDHSLAAAQVRAGDLTPAQIRLSPERDTFLRTLGGREYESPYPDFIIHDIHEGDTLVLCSDGLWSALTEEQIAHYVGTLPTQQACETLVQLANAAEGDENISIIVISFLHTPERKHGNEFRKPSMPLITKIFAYLKDRSSRSSSSEADFTIQP